MQVAIGAAQAGAKVSLQSLHRLLKLFVTQGKQLLQQVHSRTDTTVTWLSCVTGLFIVAFTEHVMFFCTRHASILI